GGRHARSERDWGSDVCASDLEAAAVDGGGLQLEGGAGAGSVGGAGDLDQAALAADVIGEGVVEQGQRGCVAGDQQLAVVGEIAEIGRAACRGGVESVELDVAV